MHRYDIEINREAGDALTLIADDIPEGSRVLDLGCGNGRLTKLLAGQKRCRVSIVDCDRILFDKAAVYAADGICADLKQYVWREYYKACRFDRIVLADVLEHLTDPAPVLKACIPLLEPDGRILISVPNFGHNDILTQLFCNDLPRTETGILDYTHMTIFTWQGLLSFLDSCGLAALEVGTVSRATGKTEEMEDRMQAPDSFMAALENRRFGEVYQWVVSCAPKAKAAGGGIRDCNKKYCDKKDRDRKETSSKSRIQTYKKKISEAEKNLDALNRRYAGLKKRLQDQSGQISDMTEKIHEMEEERCQILQISLKRDENIQHLQRVLSSLEQQNAFLEKRNRELQEEVGVFRNSTSWKVTEPCRAAGAVFRRIREGHRAAAFCSGTASHSETTFHSGTVFHPEAASCFGGAAHPEEAAHPGEAFHPGSDSRPEAGFDLYDVPLEYYHPLVSIIVPCYQHAPFLEERLSSILSQTYDKTEVILLDDGSTDGSREILAAWADRFPDAKICFNEVNTGRVFGQWQRGIHMARGDLIWIAESDDSCTSDFLETLVPFFSHECVMIAFAGSDFIRNGQKTWTSEEYLSDLHGISFEHDFILPAAKLVKEGFGTRNLIPNGSACVFRNPGDLSPHFVEKLERMKLCGDWLFYLSVMRGGCAAYSGGPRNFYRVHQQSTSLEIQKTDLYYREYGEVLQYAAGCYGPVDISSAADRLTEHYMTFRDTEKDISKERVLQLMDTKRIREASHNKKPHVLMCSFSLRAGGGETFTIYLANALKEMGCTVTFLDYRGEARDERIRGMLRRDIPLVSLSSTDHLMNVMKECGADVVHTHHASVDQAVAAWLLGTGGGPRQVVTLHGMYETLAWDDARRIIRLVSEVCRKYVFIADKNLEPFKKTGHFRPQDFRKIENALPMVPVTPIARETLGIEADDFVCVLASRGIPEKGWEEAASAVTMANRTAGRPIRLVILGEGEMRLRLEKRGNPFVQFCGVRENVRDYFSMGDVGLLPTRFKGESSPLTVIECLQSGRPVVATEIGEVRNQLTDENGNLAGELLHLKRGKVDPAELSEILVSLADNPTRYRMLKERCRSAAARFDMEKAASRYISVYREVLS